MKNRVALFFMTSMLSLWSCTGQRGLGNEYIFYDRPVRNLHLIFRKDSSYKFINTNEGSMFVYYGRWQRIDKRTFVMTNAYCVQNKCDTINKALKVGEKVNYDLMRELGTNYLFPAIMVDTVSFSKNFRQLTLKGYTFKR